MSSFDDDAVAEAAAASTACSLEAACAAVACPSSLLDLTSGTTCCSRRRLESRQERERGLAAGNDTTGFLNAHGLRHCQATVTSNPGRQWDATHGEHHCGATQRAAKADLLHAGRGGGVLLAGRRRLPAPLVHDKDAVVVIRVIAVVVRPRRGRLVH